MIIRDIKLNDKSSVISLMQKFYDMPAVLHKIPQTNYENTIDEVLNNTPYARLLVAEEDEKIAAYCLLAISYSNEAGGLCVFIEEIMTDDKYRNKGYGKALINFVFKEYEDKAKRFRLEVTKENKGAIRLYEKLGFEFLDYLQMIKE